LSANGNRPEPRLDAMDAALWAVPVRSAQTRPHIGAVLHCEGTAPSLDEVKAELADRLPKSASLRSRVNLCAKRWELAPVDLDAHVAEAVLEPGPDAVEQAVRHLIPEPLPENGPHWQLHLLHGHEPGRYVFLYRVHHALQDGAGMLGALEALFGEPAASSAVYPFPQRPKATLAEMIRTVGALGYALRRKGIWAPAGIEFSSRRTLAWADVPSDALRTAGRRHGGTANDAYLAALGHGLTEWANERHGPAIAEPPVTLLIPANVRRDPDAPGNRIALAIAEVPGGDRTADERLQAVAASTADLKSPTRRETLRHIAAAAPAWLMMRVLTALRSPARTAALASNLVLRSPLRFRGDAVTRVVPVMWAPEGVPMTALLITYQDTTSVCFTTDAAIPGLDGINERWRRTVESWTAPART
jgi:diacylglycerol O-acyltransferase / wax synthase